LLVIVLILKVHQSATIVDNLGILLGIVTERRAKAAVTVVVMMKTEHLGGVVAAEMRRRKTEKNYKIQIKTQNINFIFHSFIVKTI